MRTIPHIKARTIAYAWHGGQSSPLYAFASSGIVKDIHALKREVENCWRLSHGLTPKEYADLYQLGQYIDHALLDNPNDESSKVAQWYFDRSIGFH